MSISNRDALSPPSIPTNVRPSVSQSVCRFARKGLPMSVGETRLSVDIVSPSPNCERRRKVVCGSKSECAH